MRILAIDPAPNRSAMVSIDNILGYWKADAYLLPNDELIAVMDSFDRNAWTLVIEDMQWYGPSMTAGQSTFHTCIWIGRFWEAWSPWNSQFEKPTLVYRTTVKAHITGLSKAKDGQVRRCLLDRWGEPGKKTSRNPVTYGMVKDIWSALAVATWYLDTHGNKAITGEEDGR